MLKHSQIDAVEINRNLPKRWVNTILGQLHDIAYNNGIAIKSVPSGKKKIFGKTLTISKGGEELQVSVLTCYKKHWISYKFKGLIDFAGFEYATLLLSSASFGHALRYGHVKRLELAVDYYSHHSSQFLFHFYGARSSRVISNEAFTGHSYYCGSPRSKQQLVAYDKGQEIADKEGVPLNPKILRVETRFYDRLGQTLEQVFKEVLTVNPFANICVVDRVHALKQKTKLPWKKFLCLCETVGVAQALKQMSKHKATFLKLLKESSSSRFSPKKSDFQNSAANIAFAIKQIPNLSPVF